VNLLEQVIVAAAEVHVREYAEWESANAADRLLPSTPPRSVLAAFDVLLDVSLQLEWYISHKS
jgi:hypothetical protein